MTNVFHTLIARFLQIPEGQVERTIGLLNEGATIPFISRYRKEVTGGLDEVQIGAIKDQLDKLTELSKRKETILATIEEQEKLTPELRKRIEESWDSTEIEDLYLPYKTKRVSKAEIARRTGLSLPTAIKITDELLDNRIVRSCGRQEGASGKRPEMYEFAGDCYYSVGIDFAPTVLRALVMDLNGMPVAKANRPIPVPEDADAVIQTAAELIDQLLRESGIPLHRVLGVGVGVPGILDLDQGRVLFSPIRRMRTGENRANHGRLPAEQ